MSAMNKYKLQMSMDHIEPSKYVGHFLKEPIGSPYTYSEFIEKLSNKVVEGVTFFNDGKTAIATKAFIETGVKQGDLIEVLSGLNADDYVIQEGARTVQDNQEVQTV